VGTLIYDRIRSVFVQEPSNNKSVHTASFPEVNEGSRDEDLENRMNLARKISSQVLNLRNQAEINVRQPLSRIVVVTGNNVSKEAIDSVKDIILDEVNVKNVEYVSHTSSVIERSAKPDFSRLGPRLGELMKPVNKKIRQLKEEDISRLFENGFITIDVEGQKIELVEEDLVIQSEGIENWLVEQSEDVTVALDTDVDDQLYNEGLAREFIKRVQNIRKDAGFNVTDRIKVSYSGSERITDAVEKQEDWIRDETLSLDMQEVNCPKEEVVKSFDVRGETVTIGVRRV
jgi:isoleucyl-tRNA synthetase